MAGHSKFKNIMHRKGAQDKKRSAQFSKLSREITVAAKNTGYDACTSATNHTVDRGTEGVNRTLATLDEASLKHTGSYTSERASEEPMLLETPAGTVAVVTGTNSLNGQRAEHDWQVDRLRDPAEEPQAEEAPAAESSSGDGEGTTVAMPALGESVTEGTVSRWLKAEGDTVEVDEPLLEVSTDKVDTEIPSPVAGTLTKILVQEDETVEVGAVLALVGSGSAGAGLGAGAMRTSGAAARPRPMPPVSLLREFSPRKNGMNSLSPRAMSMPGPSSSTVSITRWSVSRRRWMRISPPCPGA